MRTSSPFYCLAAALHVVLLAASLLLSSVTADEYTYGRATFYDDNQQGSCQYFNNIPEWYGAWPDSMPGFPNCGSCWEVSCVDSDFSDGFGSTLQRSSACYDTSRSVVIQIVDRWCCGDMNHLDLGRKAYQELADVKWGVIGLSPFPHRPA
ncbi:hypothetical protein COO60DRAFT_1689872 [Scenedesmus sp. NREL 46B-D3]|nr:hypothetical protein COO60DRAFT_1689872 [Scenedesmus sp. NREL 46B-D3]